MNLEKKKRKTKKWLYHHSLAHLINDKIIANTVCLYIYYNLTYISQLSYYYSITLLHISAQNWFICLNHSSNLFIALIEKWERKKELDKNIDCIPKKNHPQRFKGLLLGVNPFLSFFAILATFWLFLAKKNLPNPWKIVFVQKMKVSIHSQKMDASRRPFCLPSKRYIPAPNPRKINIPEFMEQSNQPTLW